jgi:hypothetical protein
MSTTVVLLRRCAVCTNSRGGGGTKVKINCIKLKWGEEGREEMGTCGKTQNKKADSNAALSSVPDAGGATCKMRVGKRRWKAKEDLVSVLTLANQTTD